MFLQDKHVACLDVSNLLGSYSSMIIIYMHFVKSCWKESLCTRVTWTDHFELEILPPWQLVV